MDIKIDMKDMLRFVEELTPRSIALINEGVAQTAQEAHQKLFDLAGSRLNSSRAAYQQAIRLTAEKNGYKLSVGEGDSPGDKLAQGVESGMKPYDMVPGMLASPKAKQGKNGKYMVVPFEHKIAGGGQTSKEKALSGAVNQAIRKEGLDLKASNITQGTSFKKTLQPATPPGLGKATDSVPLLQDTKYKETGNSTKSKATATTFRVVTEKDRGVKWQHPGLQGKFLMDVVYQWVQDNLDKNIKTKLEEL